ncbi:MAG: glycosyltransferase family 4 protein, partial [Acidimicrobiales bacterium]
MGYPGTVLRLRLLLVIDSLVASGGAEQSIASIAPELIRRGMQVDVAYLHDRPGLQPQLSAAGASLFYISGGPARAVPRLAELVRRRQVDLVHTTLFEADLAGRLAAFLTGRPCVSSLVNTSYGPEHRNDPGLRAWKVRAAQLADAGTAPLVNRFHAITEHVADVMAVRLCIRRSRIEVIPRGRDPAALGRRDPARRARARSLLGVHHDVPVLLAAARQEHQKGLDVLVGAMPTVLRSYPDALLLLAGRAGNQTRSLNELIGSFELGAAVRLLGVRDDIADLMAAADVFVSPSRWEGLGSVLIEALALEVPIVATDLPAIREVVGTGPDPVGTLVPPEEPESLATAVLATLQD